jgi:hypothetical protein
MNRKDLDALNELYSSVYSEEQLNEAPLTPEQIKYKNEQKNPPRTRRKL